MGWIGVDLDGTLAEYQHGYAQRLHIGEPIALMLARVKAWRAAGTEVRIFTARVSGPAKHRIPTKALIEAWCLEHVGEVLPVTCRKDYAMVELWDDRAVQVVKNTGARADGKDPCGCGRELHYEAYCEVCDDDE
jgi:hypothetical protein